jgi:TspO/MBR family
MLRGLHACVLLLSVEDDAANFVGHVQWSPLFFTMRRPDWALVEVVFLWASVLA